MIPDATYNSFFVSLSQPQQQLYNDELNEDEKNHIFVTCPVCASVHLSVKEEEENGTKYFGDLQVYVKATCPICLEECGPPVIALPCGHILCRNDYISLGGTIPSFCTEEESITNDSSDTTPTTLCRIIPNQLQVTSESNQNDEQSYTQQSSIEESTQTNSNVTIDSNLIDESASTTTTNTNSDDIRTPTIEVENETPPQNLGLFSPSSKCKILDDNFGGTWIYCRKSKSRYWCLIHINAKGNRQIVNQKMSPNAKIVVDHLGYAWSLQSNGLSTKNVEPWNLWKYSRNEKEFQGRYHSSTTIEPCSENRVEILLNFQYLNHCFT